MVIPRRIPGTAHIPSPQGGPPLSKFSAGPHHMCSPSSARLLKHRFVLYVPVHSIGEAMDSSLQQAVEGIQLNNYISGTFTNLRAPSHGQFHCSPQWQSSQPLDVITVSDTCMFSHVGQSNHR